MLGKVAEIRGMPSPQPSPTGEGVGCSRFKRYRSSEKECPKHQRQEFFRQPLSQGRWNKCRERFFRRPLNPSVRCVPQGTHAVGWGFRENGERVRAYRTHPTMRATACYPKVGWVAKPNVFRQLSSLCWVFNPTYACFYIEFFWKCKKIIQKM